ncbi:IS200/IS605 family transposase [Cohaesibacter celericrescens]|uniref:IS200/IS605 family transposase n=1 Tax=Cohaesibacter celericrescens TaxID=2067669 RepID=A0A2N5XQ96_9HYPH|nr:IS200/IS605 family transposase [Cohaesibacter celericrescens]
MVWSTKYRYKVLVGYIRLRVREIVRQVCSENGVEIVSGALSRDHVHMFVSVPPNLSLSAALCLPTGQWVSDLMRKMKGRSSHKVQREFPQLKKRYWGRYFWGREYFSTTNGAIAEDIVLQYLKRHVQNPTDISR